MIRNSALLWLSVILNFDTYSNALKTQSTNCVTEGNSLKERTKGPKGVTVRASSLPKTLTGRVFIRRYVLNELSSNRKHKCQVSLPQARWTQCFVWPNNHNNKTKKKKKKKRRQWSITALVGYITDEGLSQIFTLGSDIIQNLKTQKMFACVKVPKVDYR